MNILMVYEDLKGEVERGGIQLHVSTLVRILRARGHKVISFEILPLHFQKDDGFQQFVTAIRQTCLNFMKSLSIFQLIKDEEIDVVHVHSARFPLFLGYVASKIGKKPLIVTIHEAYSKSIRINPFWKNAKVIIAVSKEIETILRRNISRKEKIQYIPNFLDAKFFKSQNSRLTSTIRTPKILFIGRLERDKTHLLKVLLDAAPGILQKLPNAQIWIAGQQGHMSSEIETLVRNLNAATGKKSVLLLGYVKNVWEKIDEADIVVGVGRVAMEAMAKGKPVIVGSSNGHSVSGALVTKENVDALLRFNFTGRSHNEILDAEIMRFSILRILQDRNFRVEIGHFNRDFSAKMFGEEKLAAKIEEVYSLAQMR